ncbi:kinase-like domain-containing protein [Gigaspora rosea]|uniref:Kinase-like domain-containing protein n=1 Tax=Gigaspora rosea TaxID=44941 RepID=A0A397U984_9GLOM|nr:kinase-like domain-containing protein [Gigaspora rosea]
MDGLTSTVVDIANYTTNEIKNNIKDLVSNYTINQIKNKIKDSVVATYESYINAECNKRISVFMANRAKNVEFIIETMMRTDEQSFNKEKIVYYFKAEEYNACMMELLSTFNNENKKKEYELCFYKADKNEESMNVDKDLKDTEEGLKNLDKIDISIQEVGLVQSQITKQPSDNYVKKIESNELTDPPISLKTNISKVVKKFYKGIEVECKVFKKSEDFQNHLAIIGKLDSPHILRFYGISYVDTREVMVFEFAERGSLKDLYNAYDIPWTRKIRIIRDLCRGLIFLRSVNILHHDLRCENVLVRDNLEAKLGNFRYSRTEKGNTVDLTGLATNIIHWMAPELIEKYVKEKPNEKVYTFNCEMFSFGMLIWELCYEKLPYKDRTFKNICDHVLSGKREKLSYGKFDNKDDEIIQRKFVKIIQKTWQQTPEQRITITVLNMKLEKLASKYQTLQEPQLLKNGTLNFEGENVDVPSFDLVMDLKEGIELHKKKDYANAWKCFEENANLGNISAKYWQGYYLISGRSDGFCNVPLDAPRDLVIVLKKILVMFIS